MKKLFFLALLSLQAQAFDERINSAIGLNCENSTYELIDHREGVKYYKHTYNKLIPSNFTPEDLTSYYNIILQRFQLFFKHYEDRIGPISQITILEYAAQWTPGLNTLRLNQVNFVDSIKIKEDEIHTIEFIPNKCSIDYFGFSMMSDNFSEDISIPIKINKQYWKNLDTINRTLLLGHFVFANILELEIEDVNHIKYKRKRYLNSLLLSDQFLDMKTNELIEIIDSFVWD